MTIGAATSGDENTTVRQKGGGVIRGAVAIEPLCLKVRVPGS